MKNLWRSVCRGSRTSVVARIQERDMAREIIPVSISEEFTKKVYNFSKKLLVKTILILMKMMCTQNRCIVKMMNYPRKPILERLARKVVTDGASDLHLTSSHRPRWRVDGEIRD